MSEWYTTEELRKSAEHSLTDVRTKGQLCWAADRIEELESALRVIRDYDDWVGRVSSHDRATLQAIARRALGDNDE